MVRGSVEHIGGAELVVSLKEERYETDIIPS